MQEVCAPLRRYIEGVDDGSPAEVTTAGRTAELRRKYAALLNEQTKKALRPAADERTLEKLMSAVRPRSVPSGLIGLYEFADGEFNSGVLLPELEFLRVEYALKAMEANRRAHEMDLLPKFMAHSVPFMRNAVGSHIFMMAGFEGLPEDPSVYLLDNEELMVLRLSGSLPSFITRIILMREANDKQRGPVCTGDFRDLSPVEQDVAMRVEQGVFPLLQRAGVTMFSLERESEWPQSWRAQA